MVSLTISCFKFLRGRYVRLLWRFGRTHHPGAITRLLHVPAISSDWWVWEHCDVKLLSFGSNAYVSNQRSDLSRQMERNYVVKNG